MKDHIVKQQIWPSAVMTLSIPKQSQEENHISGIGQFVFQTTTPTEQVLSATDTISIHPQLQRQSNARCLLLNVTHFPGTSADHSPDGAYHTKSEHLSGVDVIYLQGLAIDIRR